MNTTPYGLPTGSLRAPYGLPTGSLRAPYGSASLPCLSEGRTARGEANLWASSHVFLKEESASVGVTACFIQDATAREYLRYSKEAHP